MPHPADQVAAGYRRATSSHSSLKGLHGRLPYWPTGGWQIATFVENLIDFQKSLFPTKISQTYNLIARFPLEGGSARVNTRQCPGAEKS